MPDDQTPIDPSQYATPNQLVQQRLLAQKLLDQGMGPITPSPGTGAVSPFQGMAGILNAYVGQKKLQDAAAQERATNQAAGAGAASITTDGTDPNQQGPLSAAPPGPGSLVDKLLPAVARNEGNSSYAQLGPVTKTGDRAYGKYQVMGANIPQWSKEVLGTPMTPEQFLANPQAQEAIARTKLGQYAAQYGPEGALKAWFAGPTGMNNPNAKDQLGTTVASYAQRGMDSMAGMPKIAMAGPGLPTGAMGPSPAPASAPAATAAPAGGMLGATPPPAGGQVAQNTQVAAGPQGISPAVPPMPSMGAPAQAPVDPSGQVPPGMFAQRPRISQQQYYAIMSNPMASDAMKQNATAIWQSQNQPVSFKNAYGTVVMNPRTGQQQFIGDIVDMPLTTPYGTVPRRFQYQQDGTLKRVPTTGSAVAPGGGGPLNAAPPAPGGGQPAAPPGPSGSLPQAMPKFAMAGTGTMNDAGMLGANPPAKPGAVPAAPINIPAGTGAQANPAAAAAGPPPATPAGPQLAQAAPGAGPLDPEDTAEIRAMQNLGLDYKGRESMAGEVGKGAAEYLGKTRQQAYDALNDEKNLNLLQGVMNSPNYTPGLLSPVTNFKKRLEASIAQTWPGMAQQLGLDPHASSANEVAEKLTNELNLGSLRQKLGGLGQVRIFEGQMVKSAFANMDNSIAANKAVLALAQAVNQRVQDVQKYVETLPGHSQDIDIQDKVYNHFHNLPIMSPEQETEFEKQIKTDLNTQKGAGAQGAAAGSGPLTAKPPGTPGAPTVLPTLPPGATVRPRAQPEIPL